jgi:hypothetical protein
MTDGAKEKKENEKMALSSWSVENLLQFPDRKI